mgnify:CR=1 FL=1
MISVSDALSHLFDLVTATEVQAVPLRQAAGRVLARDVVATRTQPPFAASSMDGYALRLADIADGKILPIQQRCYAGDIPETLKENLEILSETHDITRFALFDQFPYTHHMEAGVFLERKA